MRKPISKLALCATNTDPSANFKKSGRTLMIVGAFVLPLTKVGMMEASATRSPVKPWTRKSSPTTAILSSAPPIFAVPDGWNTVLATART